MLTCKQIWQIILLVTVLTIPYEASAIDLFIRNVDTADWPTLRIYIRPLDPGGQPIENIDSSNFLVQSSGQTLAVEELLPFSSTREGLDLVLVLDASGTMKGQPLEDAKNAIYSLLDRVDAEDRITVIAFDDDAYLMTESGTDRTTLRSMIEQIKVAGNNSVLFKAVVRGLRYLQEEGRVGKGAVIVVSDGHDESSGAYKLEDCIREARAADIPILTLGLSNGERIYLENLEKMAERTGGSYSIATSSSQLSSLYQMIYERLRKQYIIVCRVPENQPAGQHLPLQVALNFRGQYVEATSGYITPEQVPAEVVPEVVVKEEEGWPFILWLGMGGLLVVAAGTGGWWWYINKNKSLPAVGKKKKSTRVTQASPTIPNQNNVAPTSPSTPPRSEVETKDKVDLPAAILPTLLPTGKTGRRRGQTVVATSRPKVWAVLECRSGLHAGELYPIWSDETSIGTRPGNDIVLADDAVSGQHALIVRQQQVVQLIDRDSTNGTHVNGQRIRKGTIEPGDTILLGVSEYVFQLSI